MNQREKWEYWYDRKFAGGFSHNISSKPSRIIYRFIAELKERLPQGGRVLDIGCGLGLNASILQSEGYNVYGLDIAANAVSEAASRGIKAKQGDMYSLPYVDGSFDAIFSENTIMNREGKIELSLKETHRILKKGGIACLAFFEKVVCKRTDPDKNDRYVPRAKLDIILKRYFEILNYEETNNGGKDYEVITDLKGVEGLCQSGEHTHYRPCFILTKSL